MNKKRLFIVIIILIFTVAALYYLYSLKTDSNGPIMDKIEVIVSVGPQVRVC